MDDLGARSYPAKLEPDAIVEALVELRFETPELAEITVGRLSDNTFWSDYSHARLPVADIPQPIRDSDPNLRFQPLIEMTRSDGLRAAKIGGRVLSYHVTRIYPGWEVFRKEIDQVIDHVSQKIGSLNFVRVGFRYINVFTPDKHGVGGIADTNLAINLDGKPISSPVNLSYRKVAQDAIIGVRIATQGFVIGQLPPDFSLLFDIDLATTEGFAATQPDVVRDWIERAHLLEKAEFFSLLPKAVIDRLTPKTEGERA